MHVLYTSYSMLLQLWQLKGLQGTGFGHQLLNSATVRGASADRFS